MSSYDLISSQTTPKFTTLKLKSIKKEQLRQVLWHVTHIEAKIIGQIPERNTTRYGLGIRLFL